MKLLGVIKRTTVKVHIRSNVMHLFPECTQVNGKTVGLPFYGEPGKISVYHSSITTIVLESGFGVFIQTHRPWLIRVTIPSNFNGVIQGLCGNSNQNIEDELMTAGGYFANSTQEFGDSWRFGLLVAQCRENIIFTNITADVSQYLSERYCGIMSLYDGPFGACFLDPRERIKECGVAMSTSGGDHAILCETLHNYALLCQQNVFPIEDWRNYTDCGKVPDIFLHSLECKVTVCFGNTVATEPRFVI